MIGTRVKGDRNGGKKHRGRLTNVAHSLLAPRTRRKNQKKKIQRERTQKNEKEKTKTNKVPLATESPNSLRQVSQKRQYQKRYVELKTHRTLDDQRATISFRKFVFPPEFTSPLRYKLLKVWIQSFLVDTPKVVFGHRDQEGNVLKLQSIYTDEIPRQGRDFWV
jgi:hypothetical protein